MGVLDTPIGDGIGRHRVHLTIRATINDMQIAVFLMRMLEVMFFVGLVGSSIVVLISFFEDAKELFGED